MKNSIEIKIDSRSFCTTILHNCTICMTMKYFVQNQGGGCTSDQLKRVHVQTEFMCLCPGEATAIITFNPQEIGIANKKTYGSCCA
jgi:hypothetical protein